MKPRILIAESAGFSDAALATLEGVGEIVAADLDRASLLAAVGEASVLWTRLRHQIDADVFARATQLRFVVTPTTGLDHIDLVTAARRGIQVLSLRDAGEFLKGIRATAELTIGLMLSLLRQIPAATRDVEDGHWNRDEFKGRELHGKTIGIVGYGRLGRLVDKYVRAFDVRVIACDPAPGSAGDVETVELPRLLEAADIVTVHVPLSDSTHHLIDRTALARMKPGAILINTSRGGVIDDRALLEALAGGHLAGAALDVLAGEAATGVGQLSLVEYARKHHTLLITPHIGGCTYESMEMTEVFMANRLKAALLTLREQADE